MRTAVGATWGSVTIDDMYSGARKGERYITLATLVSDVIIVQPDAYAELRFRVFDLMAELFQIRLPELVGHPDELPLRFGFR